ncbi:MAG: hypothetical protein R3Y08_06175 [Rikenellaceae bacterium]
MKAVKSTRFNEDQFAGDTQKRGTKLTPNKKSGKERHHLYQSLEVDDEDQDDEYFTQPRESILDYMDDTDKEDFDDEEED